MKLIIIAATFLFRNGLAVAVTNSISEDGIRHARDEDVSSWGYDQNPPPDFYPTQLRGHVLIGKSYVTGGVSRRKQYAAAEARIRAIKNVFPKKQDAVLMAPAIGTPVPFNPKSTSWYTTFNVNVFLQGQTPAITGTTRSFGLIKSDSRCNNPAIVYGHNVGSREYSVVQHVGYFHPSKKGTYTFNPYETDEAVYIWLGEKAKSGFTKNNVDIARNWGQTLTAPLQYYVKNAGDYIPFRMLWVNAEGCSGFSLIVNDPEGYQIVSREKELSDKQFIVGPAVGF
ncbi:GLEYA motif domain-containing protein [Hirsutella rhossiliensis]